MFNVRNVCKRVVAIVLVFIFAFTNCFTLLTTVSYAAAEELGKQQSDNFSNNIEYTVNFEKDEVQSIKVIRINSIVYYSINGDNPVELLDMSA